MSLETTLADISARQHQGRFPNEQAIHQGIVRRVLQELRWDTTVVWPECQAGQGSTDCHKRQRRLVRLGFAPCHSSSKPAIFIECKQPGKAEDTVRQALKYAFHSGVPFIVLTDGHTPSYFLPAERGSYDDHLVCKIDLFERAPAMMGDWTYSVHAQILQRAMLWN